MSKRCPKNCGCVGVCRVNLPHLAGTPHGGHVMPVESPLAHQEWFHSPETQAAIKKGELQMPCLDKSSDASHRRKYGG